MATNAGEWSSVQRPSNTSSGVRRSGLSRAARDTRRQKFSSAARAPSAPLSAWPSISTAAFIAPADVPEMPSIRSHGSSSRRSSTPQVKAPCAPPPCSAKSTRTGARSEAIVLLIVWGHGYACRRDQDSACVLSAADPDMLILRAVLKTGGKLWRQLLRQQGEAGGVAAFDSYFAGDRVHHRRPAKVAGGGCINEEPDYLHLCSHCRAKYCLRFSRQRNGADRLGVGRGDSATFAVSARFRQVSHCAPVSRQHLIRLYPKQENFRRCGFGGLPRQQ